MHRLGPCFGTIQTSGSQCSTGYVVTIASWHGLPQPVLPLPIQPFVSFVAAPNREAACEDFSLLTLHTSGP